MILIKKEKFRPALEFSRRKLIPSVKPQPPLSELTTKNGNLIYSIQYGCREGRRLKMTTFC